MGRQKGESARQEDSEKGHVSSPTRSTELTTRDVKTPDQEVPMTEFGQVVLRPKGAKHANMPSEDGESTPSSSPVRRRQPLTTLPSWSPNRGPGSPVGRSAIVSRQGEDVQTVNIDA